MADEKILFVDTNIWLDFYRSRTDAGLKFLEHLEDIKEKIVITHQLEMEFKKNRQKVILEGFKELKSPESTPIPALFSNAQTAKVITKNIKDADKRIKDIKRKLKNVMANPAAHDPVYKASQRIFHHKSDLALTRDDKIRRRIRSRAFKRFIMGCPPRKPNDTSIGDAINWEWMIECSINRKADLVIVSRDADYGANLDGTAYINDHLRQEFKERVSRKGNILLYTKLSEALRNFKVSITQKEEKEEEEIISARPTKGAFEGMIDALPETTPSVNELILELIMSLDDARASELKNLEDRHKAKK